jgi:hypothetical protein
MKCSDCSKEVRPVVAIDIDGTLGDYHFHFMTFASLYMGKHSGYLDAKDYNGKPGMREWFMRETGWEERSWRDIKLAYRQGAQKRSMPPYRFAKEFVTILADSGAEVWLTTTRPYLRLDNIDPDTRFWLARHAIPYEGLIFDEDKYQRLAELVDKERVVAVLDDLPEQIDAAEKVFGRGIPLLNKTQYNLAYWEAYCNWCVDDLLDAGAQIKQRVEEWNRAHS